MTSKQLFDMTMRIQIERWTAEAAAREAAGLREFAVQIRSWIAQAQSLIRDST